jgi:hypothetical protein
MGLFTAPAALDGQLEQVSRIDGVFDARPRLFSSGVTQRGMDTPRHFFYELGSHSVKRKLLQSKIKA